MPRILQSIFLLLSFLVHANYGHAQYCTAVGPTTSTWSNVESANITGEEVTSISFTGCPGVSSSFSIGNKGYLGELTEQA